MAFEDQTFAGAPTAPSPARLMLADIAVDSRGPDATPLVRFLAMCAMHKPKTLRQVDVEQLAEVMIRRGQRSRDRKAEIEGKAEVISIVYAGVSHRPQHRMPRVLNLSDVMIAAE